MVQIDLLPASVLSILSISQRWSDLNRNHKVMSGKDRDILYINRKTILRTNKKVFIGSVLSQSPGFTFKFKEYLILPLPCLYKTLEN